MTNQVESSANLRTVCSSYTSTNNISEQGDADEAKCSTALPRLEVLRIGSQIAAGLAAAPEQGLIHRYIKPENILLEEGVERVTITDFGLARSMDDNTITQLGSIAGTPQYVSPEQGRGEQLDQQSDLFCLGSLASSVMADYVAGRQQLALRRRSRSGRIVKTSWTPVQSLYTCHSTPVGRISGSRVLLLMQRSKSGDIDAGKVPKSASACQKTTATQGRKVCPCDEHPSCDDDCNFGTGLFYTPAGLQYYLYCLSKKSCDPYKLKCYALRTDSLPCGGN